MLTREDLKVLSRWELAVMLMSSLWKAHDLGGVSLGRSQINAVFESLYWVIEKPEVRPGEKDFNVWDELIREVERRIKGESDVQLSLFLDLRYLPLEHFAALVFTTLEMLYERIQRNPEFILSAEERIVKYISRLLQGKELCAQFSDAGFSYVPRALIMEGYEKQHQWHEDHNREENVRLFEQSRNIPHQT